MMNYLVIPVVVGIITYGIYKLFELFVCRRERLNIIDKLSENTALPTDKLSLDSYFQSSFSYSALKAGCLLMGIGLGLLVGFIISNNIDYYKNWDLRQTSSLIIGSCVLLFGGIGLITAFLIELKIGKKK
ncbi:hypothetical protein D0T87_12325 [Bacteroides sp. 51]|nr:hypothetical protein [Bacteroides sp. 51]